jgi:hypothetical protein
MLCTDTKKSYVVFQTVYSRYSLTHPQYVKKLNYSSIWLKEQNLHSDLCTLPVVNTLHPAAI